MQMNKELPGNQYLHPLFYLLLISQNFLQPPFLCQLGRECMGRYLYVCLEYSIGLFTMTLLSKALIL